MVGTTRSRVSGLGKGSLVLCFSLGRWALARQVALMSGKAMERNSRERDLWELILTADGWGTKGAQLPHSHLPGQIAGGLAHDGPEAFPQRMGA